MGKQQYAYLYRQTKDFKLLSSFFLGLNRSPFCGKLELRGTLPWSTPNSLAKMAKTISARSWEQNFLSVFIDMCNKDRTSFLWVHVYAYICMCTREHVWWRSEVNLSLLPYFLRQMKLEPIGLVRLTDQHALGIVLSLRPSTGYGHTKQLWTHQIRLPC